MGQDQNNNNANTAMSEDTNAQPQTPATPPEGINIVAQEIGDALKISLVDNKTAHLLAHS